MQPTQKLTNPYHNLILGRDEWNGDLGKIKAKGKLKFRDNNLE
jgi:hypothetical protein